MSKIDPTNVNAISLPPDTLQVTLVPELWEFHCADTTGQPLGEPLQVSGDRFENVAEILVLACLDAGSGVQYLDLAEMTGQPHRTIDNSMQTLTGFLPPNTFAAEKSYAKLWKLTLGNLALASRQPMPAEIAAAIGAPIDKSNNGLRAAHLKRREKALTEDGEKHQFTIFDHAIIQAYGKSYYLRLDSPEALLVPRVLRYIREMKTPNFMPIVRDMARHVWGQMPLTERQLFASSTKDLYEAGNAQVKDAMEQILALTTTMGVTARLEEGRPRLRRQTANIDISLSTRPLSPSEIDTMTQLRLSTLSAASLPSTEQVPKFDTTDMAAVREIMRLLGSDEQITHSMALAMIEATTDDRQKHALESLLDSNNEITFSQAVDLLRKRAMYILGSGYESAFANRLIAGNKSHAGKPSFARQVTGRVVGGSVRSDVGTWLITHPRRRV